MIFGTGFTNAVFAYRDEVTPQTRRTPFAFWKINNFGPTELLGWLSDGSLSLAGDGVTTLMKYAFGLNPHQPFKGPLVETLQIGDHLAIRYQRLPFANDLSYIVEVAGDPAGPWRSGPNFTAQTSLVQNNNWTDTVTVQHLASISQHPQRFIRVRVERINLDTNGDGLPDDWELLYFGTINVNPLGDSDGDGVTNLQDYLNGTDPTDYYDGRTPFLQLISGDHQNTGAGQSLALPLTVTVEDAQGNLLKNASVTFLDGAARRCDVRTHQNGVASLNYQFPSALPGTYAIRASAWQRHRCRNRTVYRKLNCATQSAHQRLRHQKCRWQLRPHRYSCWDRCRPHPLSSIA